MPLESIRQLIKQDLAKIDQYIIAHLDSHIPIIKDVIEYLMTCGGKRIRPMVLILSAHALTNQSNQHTMLAAVIELIHTATLLHDDVIDGSTLRRGHQTAHTIWGSKESILIGDFLYTKAFQMLVDLQHDGILEIFAQGMHYMTEGEILQLVNCNNPDTAEDFYFDIIKRKTGKLFEISSQLGAIISTTSESHRAAMKDYGAHLGLAYQLIDDALDYSQSAEQTGKNVGQDLAEGKATLPLIHAMRHCQAKDLNFLRDAIQTGSNKHLQNILEIIEYTDAIKYTADAANHHATIAKQALQQIPASPYRKALEELSDFVVNRQH